MQEKEYCVKEKRNSGGRPKLPPGEKRTHRIEFWLNDAELADLRNLVDHSAMSEADLVRSLIQKKPIRKISTPAVNRKTYAELGQVGNNVNQLAKMANSYGYAGQADDLGELYCVIQKLRKELLGVTDDCQD